MVQFFFEGQLKQYLKAWGGDLALQSAVLKWTFSSLQRLTILRSASCSLLGVWAMLHNAHALQGEPWLLKLN